MTGSTPDRFRNFVERIAAWTEEELTVVDARQCRHVAQVVIAGADPIYPPFGPSAFETVREGTDEGREAVAR